MTTTARSLESATRTHPGDRPARPAGLVPLGLGAAAWVAGQAALPDLGTGFEDRLAAVAAARGAQQLATVLLFLAGVALVVAATGLRTRASAGPRPRLATAGSVALGLGGIWLCAGRAAFNLQMLKASSEGVDVATGLAVLEGSEGAGFAPFPLTLLALLVAPLLLAASAPHGRRWIPAACWVVGIGIFLAGEFRAPLVEVVGVSVAAVGLLLAGSAHLRSPAPSAP